MRTIRRVMICLLLGAFAYEGLAVPLGAQLDALRKEGVTATEEAIYAVLKQGIQENRAAEVAVVTGDWLQKNQVKNVETLYLAGVSAELSALPKDAVTYYRKVLTASPIDPGLVAKAGPAFYRLIIVGMQDPDSAYLFMREHGNRLRAYGNLWKFDDWFLQQARARNDLAGTLERLANIYNDNRVATSDVQGYLDDALVTLASFEHGGEELAAAMHTLATAQRVTPAQKARLLWITEVVPLNVKVSELVSEKKEVPATLFKDAVAAAAELVRVEPLEGSRLVARGWCHFSDNHVPTVLEKASLHAELKSPMLLSALSGLQADEVRSVLSTRGPQGIHVGVVLRPADAWKLVALKPAAFNALNAPDLSLYRPDLTVQVAATIAPHLAKNPYPHAAVVRAVAAGNNSFTKAAAYIAENEMWRFSESYVQDGSLGRFLWECGLERDGDFRKMDELLKQAGTTPQDIADALQKNAGDNKVNAAQQKLATDLLSASPAIPCGLDHFDRLADCGSEKAKAYLLAMLAAVNLSGDRETLFYRAVRRVRFGDTGSDVDMAGPEVNDRFLRYGRQNALKAGVSLAPRLQGILSQQMQGTSIHEGLLGLWIRTVKPEDGRVFMKQMVSSPAWGKVDPAYLQLARQDAYFGNAIPDAGKDARENLSRELLALPEAPSAEQVKTALSTVLRRVAAAPGFPRIEGLDRASSQMGVCAPYAGAILDDYAPLDLSSRMRGYCDFSQAYMNYLLEKKTFSAIQPRAQPIAELSRALDRRDLSRYETLVKLTQAAFSAGDTCTAVTLSRAGLRVNGSDERLKQVLGKASEEIGVTRITVEKGEPGYSIFLSQKEFILENPDGAWALYDEHADELIPVLEKLRLDYCFWVLDRNVEKGEVERVEELVQHLTIWDGRGNAALSLEQQAALRLAYAKVAFQKNAYGVARSWYGRVSDNKSYQGSPQYYEAVLGIVAVDREEKKYSDALRALDRLLLVKDEALRIRVRYARARIFYAQEKYAEAGAELEQILQQDPQNADALILQGKVQFAKRDFVASSKIRIGPKRSTKAIEPGKSIEIDLDDSSLSISGEGLVIEVEARAASGDVERMPLRSVDEKRTIYRAEVPTELGAPRPGDKVLQVLGRDTITYGFSKRFRETMDDLPPDRGESVMIASDFVFDISAGDFPKREGEIGLSLEELGVSTADKAMGWSRIRPGNPFYIRVNDPDQSRTAGRDSVAVEVRSSSGDIIRKFNLQETGPFTGVFEGTVPTAGGQAVAYAYDSEPGIDPNMAISPRKDYPPWRGRTINKTWNKFFTVDLNDVVGLKTMSLTSPESGALKRFVVQTSGDGKAWDSVGCFPEGYLNLFDGRPLLRWVYSESLKLSHNGSTLSELPETWVDGMTRAMADPGIGYENAIIPNINGKFPFDFPSRRNADRNRGRLMHFHAIFYHPDVSRRRFQVTLTGEGNKEFPGVILVDGEPSAGEDKSVIDREFKPGLHTVELWALDAQINLPRTQLLCDGKDGEMAPCPDAMFDPATFPPAIQEGIRGRAAVSETGTGSYQINFGRNTHSQFIRLLIGEHAGEAPELKEIGLTDTKGQQKLPVAADYQALRENQQLEVLPGDTIMVKYVDDLAYTEERTQQEKRLSVAHNDGSISAVFVDYGQAKDGSRFPILLPIRRFCMGDTVLFVISDLDMDVSSERDMVPFSVKTSDGKTSTYKAYETEAHSGEFHCKIFPVEGVPQRESEIQISEGGTLTGIYRDMENLKPGVPANRSFMIEHAKYMAPEFGVYTMSREPAEFVKSDPVEGEAGEIMGGEESVMTRMRVNSRFLSSDDLKNETPQALLGGSIEFSVIASHLALHEGSRISAFAQTESGRRAYLAMRKEADGDGKKLPDAVLPFDPNVPGTIAVKGYLGRSGKGEVPPGYVWGGIEGQSPAEPRRSGNALDGGQFGFSVGLSRGKVPERSFANKAAEGLLEKPGRLTVQPGDTVYIGYAYFDKQGKVHWYTASVKLCGDVLLDVMDASYRYHLSTCFVGEKAYVRVIAPERDVSIERDEVTVQVAAASGVAIPFTIRETAGNTGVFKGHFALGILEKPGEPLTPEEFFVRGLPVQYSDTVTVSMDAAAAPSSFSFSINNGADGLIQSFSKRYSDNSTALQANFTLAECYFELAKMHRMMGEADEDKGEPLISLSRREMAHAKKLLQEALATRRDPDQQAHAEYLLGNLAQEYADTAENEEVKESNYKDALARFSSIPADYPDSPFASKAQYKRALVYEKMGELEIAVEEYVKLGYKYPDNELIPEAMSRIGGFFEKRGLATKKEGDELMAKDDDTSLSKARQLLDSARRDFKWAASVYLRVQERYTDHPLAGIAGILGGQNRMRYGDFPGAVEAFSRVYCYAGYDGPDERAQALFWAGMAYEKLLNEPVWSAPINRVPAVAHYEVLRSRWPASKWAKMARGRLASGAVSLANDERRRLPDVIARLNERMQ